MRLLLELYGLEAIFIFVFILLFWTGIGLKRDFWKHVFFNLGAVFLALFIFELFLTIRALPNTVLTRDFEYFQSDSLLGYSAKDSGAYEVNVLKKFTKSEDTIYHAQYGFENGYRVTKSADSTHNYAAFLGGSFIFGEGVNDHETLPSYYSKLANEVQVFNYGFHGYGPHQVLMQLRHRVFQEEKIPKERNGYVYYLFIPPHIGRAHGRTDWDKTGPYFYLAHDSLVWGGTFYDKRIKTSIWNKLSQAIILKSRIYNLYFRTYVEGGAHEMNLIVALINEMNEIVESEGLKFRVILEYQLMTKVLVDNLTIALNKSGIEYLDTYDAIANKTLEDTSLYMEGDLHPTPRFYQLLAEYLYQETSAAGQ